MANGGDIAPYGQAPLSRQEQLSRQFSEWERRGRGWQLWGCPVELEPPFRPPYVGYAAPSLHLDDARKPTILSGLIEKLFGQYGKQPSDDILPQPLSEYTHASEPAPFTGAGEQFLEVQISLPHAHKITQGAAEQFLLSLTYCTAPVSFEVIGSRDSIIVQMATTRRDHNHLKQQVRAYFPEATLTTGHGTLETLWQSGGAPASVIVDFGLSKEFMLPLHVTANFEIDLLIAVVGVA